MGRLLSGFQDEGIVVEQGQRVGGELIEFRVAQLQGRLGLTRGLALVQKMGYVIGTESAGGESFLQGLGHLLRAISTEQIKEFLKLAEEGTVRARLARTSAV